MKKLVCAECGKVIEENYVMVGDNFLQVKYFDEEEDNVFCSEECLCKSLSVISVDWKANDNA